jgi:hypothetical protein
MFETLAKKIMSKCLLGLVDGIVERGCEDWEMWTCGGKARVSDLPWLLPPQ